MKKVKNVLNSNMRKYVSALIPFVNGNKTVFADLKDNGIYVVYSYGYHYPMLIWEPVSKMWFVNEDKVSRTTSMHKSKARPYNIMSYNLRTQAMIELSYNGYASLANKRMNGGFLLSEAA
jgi:hypothetical protein